MDRERAGQGIGRVIIDDCGSRGAAGLKTVSSSCSTRNATTRMDIGENTVHNTAVRIVLTVFNTTLVFIDVSKLLIINEKWTLGS